MYSIMMLRVCIKAVGIHVHPNGFALVGAGVDTDTHARTHPPTHTHTHIPY